jgi:hypothetical protein
MALEFILKDQESHQNFCQYNCSPQRGAAEHVMAMLITTHRRLVKCSSTWPLHQQSLAVH